MSFHWLKFQYNQVADSKSDDSSNSKSESGINFWAVNDNMPPAANCNDGSSDGLKFDFKNYFDGASSSSNSQSEIGVSFGAVAEDSTNYDADMNKD